MENISEILLIVLSGIIIIFLIMTIVWLSIISKQNREAARVLKAIGAYYEKKRIKVRTIEELSLHYYLIVFEEREIDEEILRIKKQGSQYQIVRSYQRVK